MSRPLPNAAEMGKKGGNALKEQVPPGYYATIGERGNAAMKERGPEFFKERARKIAAARKRNKREKESPVNKFVNLLSGK